LTGATEREHYELDDNHDYAADSEQLADGHEARLPGSMTSERQIILDVTVPISSFKLKPPKFAWGLEMQQRLDIPEKESSSS
jgi:hypothetical protein